MALEVLTMGRVGVDLYPEQIGLPLAEVRTFRKMLGGSPTNVAVAAARLGRRAGVITKVGDDPFGPYAREALRRFGVDPSRVGTDPDLRTPVVFCEIFPPDRFPLLFSRQPQAAARPTRRPRLCSTSGPGRRSSSSGTRACSLARGTSAAWCRRFRCRS